MDNTLNIIKFACLAFTTHEYYEHSEKELLKMRRDHLESKYLLPEFNRSKRNKIERQIGKEMKEYLASLKEWRAMLRRLSDSFIRDPKHADTYNLTIDLIHRTMDQFEISNDVVVHDPFKQYYFEQIDRIKKKERTEDELIKLKAAFNNFLTTNKLI